MKENIEKAFVLMLPIVVLAFLVFYPSLNVQNVKGSFDQKLPSQNYEIEKLKDISKLSNKIMLEGSGFRTVKEGDAITVNYKGWLAKDGKVFDDSLSSEDKPFQFTVGQGVIKGWSEGVVGMKKGEIRRLYIPSSLGYGKAGSSPNIPSNADLIFDVELLDFSN